MRLGIKKHRLAAREILLNLSKIMFFPKHFLPGNSSSLLSCRSVRAVLLAASVIQLSGPVYGASITWTGASGTWTTPGNWNGGTVPGSGDTAEFNGAFTTQPSVTSTATVGGIWATTGLTQGVTIGGSSALTLVGTQTINGSANTAILLDDSANNNLTISAPLTLTNGNNTSFLVNNSGTLTIQTGALSLGTATLTLGGNNAAGAISIASAIGGTGAIVANSAGSVTLSGGNAYSGGTIVKSGTLTVTAGTSLGTGSVTIGDSSGSNNATLLSSVNGTTANAIGFGSTTGVLTIEGQTNTQIFSGAVALTHDLTVDNLTSGKTTTLSGTITETGARTITKGTGAGAVALTGSITLGASGITFVNNASTATGSLTISASTPANATGTIALQDNGVAPTVYSGTLNSSAAQTLVNSGTGSGSVTFSGVATAGHLTVTQNSSNSPLYITGNDTLAAVNVQNGVLQVGTGASNQNIGAAPATVSSTGTLNFDGANITITSPITNNGTLQFLQASTNNGVISGSGNVVVNPGAATVIDNVFNTYTGTTTLSSGTLSVGSLGVFASAVTFTNGSNAVTMASSTGTLLSVGELMFGNSYLASPATITGISTSGTVTTVTLSGTANTGTTSNTATSQATFYGLPSDGLGATTNALVLNGGVLSANSTVVTNRLFNLGPNGGGIDQGGSAAMFYMLNQGAIGYTTPDVTETLTLSSNHVIAGQSSSSQRAVGNVGYFAAFAPQLVDNGAGALTLVKTGTGAWVISGANNTYSGGTLINSGLLQAQTPGSLGTGPVNVSPTGTLVLNVGGTSNITGAQEFMQSDLFNFFSSISNVTFQPGSSFMLDPSDIAGSSGYYPNNNVGSTATFTYTGAINLPGVNFGRINNTGGVGNSSDLILAGNINLGSGSLSVIGNSYTNSYLELEGNNTFTGPVYLNAGNSSGIGQGLVLGSIHALGDASGPGASQIVVQSSSSLAVDPGFPGLSTTPLTVSQNIFFSGAGATLLVGNLTLGGISNQITFTGAVVGNHSTTGASEMALWNTGSGTTTFSGPVYITDGTSASSFGNLYLRSLGGPIVISGAVADAAPASLGGGNGGVGSLMEIGYASGSVFLTGNNTYTGGTSLAQGKLSVLTFGNYGTGQASSLGSPATAAAGVIGIDKGATLSDIGTTAETSNRQVNMLIAGTSSITLDYSGSGTLNLTGGVSSAISATAGTHTVTLQGTPTGSGLGEISGVISDAPTTQTVTAYSAAASGATSLTVLNSESLVVGGGALTVSGAGIANGTTVTGSSYNSLTLSGATTGSITAGETLTVSGGAAQPTAVAKTGSGTWVLANVANTYSGSTSVNGGTLQVAKLTNEGSGGGTASSIGESSNAASNLILNGGTLSYIGSGDTTDRNFEIGTTSNGSTGTWDASGTGALTITGSATYGTVNQWRLLGLSGTSTAANTLSGAIADNGNTASYVGITKSGAGTWVLSGANTYSGVTTLNGGILSVSNIGNAGVNATMTTTANGNTATVSSASGLAVGMAIYDNPNIPNGTLITAINGTTITLSSGSGVTAGSNVATQFGTASNIGIGSGAGALVFNGGTLQYTGTAVTTNRSFTITPGGATLDASGTGAINFAGGGITLNTNSVTHTLTLTGTNTGTNTLADVLGDAGGSGTVQTSLVKTGVGAWYLNGANTFTGSVAVNSGVLGINTVALAGSTQSLGKGTGAVTLGVAGTSSGMLLYTGGTGTLGLGVTALGNGSDTIQNNGSGLLTLAGTLTKSGTVLTLNGGSNGINVTGQITGGTPSTFNSDLNIINGVTTLSASNNNYTGPTNIYNAGTLKLGAANAVPTGSVINMGNATDGAVTNKFDLAGFNQTVGALNSTSNGGGTNSNIVTNSATGTSTSTLTLTGVNSDSATVNGTFGGVIQNGSTASTALLVTGGTQTLTNANTYSGGTTVNGGKLLVGNGNNGSALGSGPLSIGSSGTIGGTGNGLTGIVLASNFTINGKVIVGNGSDATSSLKIAAPGSPTVDGTLSGANLTFNLNSAVAGQANVLDLGSTNVTFNSTTLTLNLLGVSVISPYTPYTLITDAAGYNSATDGLMTQSETINGHTYNVIVGGLSIAASQYFGASVNGLTPPGAGLYANSFLYLDSNGTSIDVMVVPEPGTWALMLGGLGLLICWQRRRNRDQ